MGLLDKIKEVVSGNNEKKVLPIEIDPNEAPWFPQIHDQKELSKKRQELQSMVAKAAEDGNISLLEYQELQRLTVLVGVNNTELAKLIITEYKQQLKKQIQLCASDGDVNESEMEALVKRAKELGMSKEELMLLINEALSNHKEEVRKRVTVIMAGLATTLLAAGCVAVKILMETSAKGNLKMSFSVKNKNITKDTTITRNYNTTKTTTINHKKG